MLPIFRKKKNTLILSEEEAGQIAFYTAVWLISITFIILLFGLAMLYSTSFGIAGSGFFRKQIMWALIGLAGAGGVILLGAVRVSNWSSWMMLGVGLLLLIADFCFPAVKGAHRWIQIPGVGSIQPSEYAKVILTLFLAKILSTHTRQIESTPFRLFVMTGLCCAPVIGLVLIGHDLGTTSLLTMLFFVMCYVAGIKARYIFPIPLILGTGVFFYCKFFDPMRWDRLTVFLNPEAAADKEGYQLWLSLLALGSGKWTGLGFTESRLKMKYLPEAHTDFILSIVGEEMGLVCMLLVLLAYILFIFSVIRIAKCARTRQGMLICFGVAIFIAMQSFINISVISGAFPTKGMPAPFISYGGSNLVTCLVAAGLVVSVALDAYSPDYPVRRLQLLKDKFQQWKNRLASDLFGSSNGEKNS